MFDTRPWSDIDGAAEARERAGRAKSRLRHSPATRARIAHRRSSPVRILFEHAATGERHHLTRLEARQTLGLRRDAISHILAGRRKTSRGYRIIERSGA